MAASQKIWMGKKISYFLGYSDALTVSQSSSLYKIHRKELVEYVPDNVNAAVHIFF